MIFKQVKWWQCRGISLTKSKSVAPQTPYTAPSATLADSSPDQQEILTDNSEKPLADSPTEGDIKSRSTPETVSKKEETKDNTSAGVSSIKQKKRKKGVKHIPLLNIERAALERGNRLASAVPSKSAEKTIVKEAITEKPEGTLKKQSSATLQERQEETDKEMRDQQNDQRDGEDGSQKMKKMKLIIIALIAALVLVALLAIIGIVLAAVLSGKPLPVCKKTHP